jgi:type VI secretion system VgrG family protein
MSIQTRFYFQSKASSLVQDTFRVIRFNGQEEISQPFRFEIELVSDNADIDPDEVLQWPAFLTIERDGKRRMVHGVLAVPRLWLLSMSQQNQIYQDKSVPEIVEEELKGSKDKGPAGLAAANLTTKDFELRLTRKYQKREYVVQYGESDLNFISRLMEHEGLFYFFEHDDEKEKIIITDDNIHFPAIAEESSIPYRSPSGMVIADEESVRAISCRHRRMPKKLILKDYNYRTPHVPLQGEANVDGKGHGLISEYGNHFKTPEEGVSLAKIRAEEIRCRHAVFRGEGDCSLFLPGHRYTLEGHFRKDFNREYVITGVEHDGTQPIAGVSGLANDGAEQLTYRNTFTAITSDVPFRPERNTPKPRMYGIMNAHVDAALLTDRAEVDDQGRYKVVMPFDLSGSGEGKASRFVRMAQPYGGGSHGMHFPLHKDVEVIWACIDGDPDRPIIVGTVPNPLNPSVVTADNSTKNVIKTASGSFLEFNDGPGLGGMVQKTGGPQLQRQQQYQYEAGSQGQLLQQQQMRRYDTVEEEKPRQPGDTWFRVKVPNYDGTKDCYLRLGKDPGDENTTAIIDPNKLPDHPEAGWFDYTDGSHTSVTGKGSFPDDHPSAVNDIASPYSDGTVDAIIDGDKTNAPSWERGTFGTSTSHVQQDNPPAESSNAEAQPAAGFWAKWEYRPDVVRKEEVWGSWHEHIRGDRKTVIEGTWDLNVKGPLYNTYYAPVRNDFNGVVKEVFYDDMIEIRRKNIYEYNYGDQIIEIWGNQHETIHGKHEQHFKSPAVDVYSDISSETFIGLKNENFVGGKLSTFTGASVDTYMGFQGSGFLGGKVDLFGGAKFEAFLALALTIGLGAGLDVKVGPFIEKKFLNVKETDLQLNKRLMTLEKAGLDISQHLMKIQT